ncbi:MAG TPA: STAS domain-containing protein [Phycisphaerales bacterium]|nr:STAS domain-containing protein [Phycisphaerales bacterium]
MNIHEQRHGAVTVIKPEGPLTSGDAVIFRQRLGDVMQRSLGRLVVDASAVAFVDSQGLEVLADASDQLSSSGRVLRMCGTTETLREVLDVTGLSEKFEHYADVNTAVRSFL